VSPNERDSVCATCGHKGLECSGHPGHIELVVPAYNPLVVDVLLKLLRMNCFHCHRFRIRERIKEDYVIMLELLRNDRIKEAYEYYDINVEEEKRKMDKMEAESETDKAKE
jgi:DNA-directed RNA polymerase I subunit RPA1